MDIYSCLLGSPITGLDQKWKTRIFYLSIITMSSYISNFLLDMGMEYEIQVIRNTVSNDQDLLRLKLPIYTFLERKHFSADRRDLIDGLRFVDDTTYDCMDDLHKKHDGICFHFELAIHEVSSTQKKKLDED